MPGDHTHKPTHTSTGLSWLCSRFSQVKIMVWWGCNLLQGLGCSPQEHCLLVATPKTPWCARISVSPSSQSDWALAGHWAPMLDNISDVFLQNRHMHRAINDAGNTCKMKKQKAKKMSIPHHPVTHWKPLLWLRKQGTQHFTSWKYCYLLSKNMLQIST